MFVNHLSLIKSGTLPLNSAELEPPAFPQIPLMRAHFNILYPFCHYSVLGVQDYKNVSMFYNE